MKRAVAGAVLALAASVESRAMADDATATEVVLIQPEAGDPVLAEALHRLRGELQAVGFTVQTGPGPDHDPRWELEVAAGPTAKVGITLRRSRKGDGVDLWLLDRISGKTSIRSISVSLDSPEAPQLLAVQTVELLRASLAELVLAPRAGAPPRPPLPPQLERLVAPPTPTFAGYHASIGVALRCASGLDPAVLPVLRVGKGIGPIVLRLSLGATVVPTTARSDAGEIGISERLAAIELAYVPWARAPLSPFATVGVGVENVEVAALGTSAGFAAITQSNWSASFSAGPGVVWRATSHFALAGEAQLLLLVPDHRISAGGVAVGRLGFPSWIPSLEAILLF